MRQISNDGDNDVRIQAAISLIRLGEEGLFAALVKSLAHPEPRVVIGAALVLGRLADGRAAKYLREAFKTRNRDIGAAVAWAIGQCRDVRALPWLIAAIQHDFAAANACEALGKIGDMKALNVLLEALSSKNEDVRAYAARAIGMLNFENVLDARDSIVLALEARLKDASRKVRLCSALALHHLGQTKMTQIFGGDET